MNISLKAEPRTIARRADLVKLRRQGKVPGVLYGKDMPAPTPIMLESTALQAVMRSHPHAIIELDVLGMGKWNVLLSEVQRDRIGRQILHADFHKINMNEKIRAHVRLEMAGRSAGESEGGMLQVILHEAEVECLPKDLPETIAVDVSGLQIGETLTASDIPVPAGVKLHLDADAAIVSVLAPQKERAEEELEAMDDKAEENAKQAKVVRNAEVPTG